MYRDKDGKYWSERCPKCDDPLSEDHFGHFCNYCKNTYVFGGGRVDREDIKCVPASNSEIRNFQYDVEYDIIREYDRTKASKWILFWGFHYDDEDYFPVPGKYKEWLAYKKNSLPTEFSVNRGPGGYLDYDLYVLFVKAFMPNVIPMQEHFYHRLLDFIWY